MKAFYSDHFVLPLPDGHRFPMLKYRLLRDSLQVLLPVVQLLEAPAASDGELALAHSSAYVADLIHGRLSAPAQREIGFPWSVAMVERARRSVGATIAAARSALSEGLAANLAGGTHHGYGDKGGGFCVFNDVAVAARLMQAEWSRPAKDQVMRSANQGVPSPLKVAVIDLDVHQGNGTASIFQADDSVFTLSLHGEKNFPFRKERSDLDVGLPDDCADEPYLVALEQALDAMSHRFDPALVLYLAGADPYVGDRLGRLALSFDGLQARDRRVFDWCFSRRIPMAFVMAGGYGTHIEETVQVQLNTYRIAMEYWHRWQNRNS